jgi:tRNA 2-selenouridine synthase
LREPSSRLISSQDLWQRLVSDEVRIIDVRAPIEFVEGAIPCSINLPILNDKERAAVGTVYKQEGSEQAVALGHQLVRDEIKAQRTRSWVQAIGDHPKESVITCFRGGMRSQLAQTWCEEQGVFVSRLEGGYKKMRQFLTEKTESFCKTQKLWVLTGKTGAGKTRLLHNLSKRSKIDLEALARHRGSAFGAYAVSQPAQIDFENNLSLTLGRMEPSGAAAVVEDESRMIGRVVLPNNFFELLRESPVLVLDEPLDVRIENTFQEYVVARADDAELFSDLRASLLKIRNKLGGARHQEIASDLTSAEKIFAETKDLSPSRVWIEKLLSWYYDPMYEASFVQRKPSVLARGSVAEIQAFLEPLA